MNSNSFGFVWMTLTVKVKFEPKCKIISIKCIFELIGINKCQINWYIKEMGDKTVYG